jgi:hypothetical protein
MGRAFDPNAMKDFNPFYARPGTENTQGMGPGKGMGQGRRFAEFFTALERQAGKPHPAQGRNGSASRDHSRRAK